tara:strand:+ start:401 stop:877 length:477 start_codon:yes stop_codon:yes gene_type:complete
MRKLFSQLLHKEMSRDERIILITGDLGYGLWDRIKIDYSDRFYNVGSAEQLMVGMACGFAMEDMKPICYSITPFLLYRPFELIRNYLDHEEIPVKLVGGGRDDDYGYLGFSHWAKDDKIIMGSFNNITTIHPRDEEDLKSNFNWYMTHDKPTYINLSK